LINQRLLRPTTPKRAIAAPIFETGPRHFLDHVG
jgi:hypothetical protein